MLKKPALILSISYWYKQFFNPFLRLGCCALEKSQVQKRNQRSCGSKKTKWKFCIRIMKKWRWIGIEFLFFLTVISSRTLCRFCSFLSAVVHLPLNLVGSCWLIQFSVGLLCGRSLVRIPDTFPGRRCCLWNYNGKWVDVQVFLDKGYKP